MPTTPARDTPRSRQTQLRLLAAAREVACAEGVAGASARKISGAAGVNQALVFYHFETVNELIAASSNFYVDEALDQYREALRQARTLTDLLEIADGVRSQEGQKGNAAFMAQILAAADQDSAIGGAARYALDSWTAQIADALERITAPTPVSGLVDARGLAPLLTAAFVGLELYDGANPRGGQAAKATLESLTKMLDSLLDAGPIVRTALSQATKRISRS